MTLSRIDGRPLAVAPGEILAIACARNEVLRLASFLDHHRAQGVNRFLVVDNDSTDGTTELLLAEPDVHVFSTRESYAASSCGTRWINELVARFAVGYWTLTADVDELLVFPHAEHLTLGDLTRHLEATGSEAMAALLLDMYAAGPIADAHHVPGTSLVKTCPYFDDRDSYSEPSPRFQGLPVRGGARARRFRFEAGDGRGPLLGKIPLVRWRPGPGYEGYTHWLPGYAPAGVTGVLLHFKFLSDFATRVEIEAARGEHWEDAIEYKSYLRGVREDPRMTLLYAGSVRYAGSRQLVELGLMKTTRAFETYAAGRPP